MSHFKLHTGETAPEGSRSILEGAEKSFGFAPNLFRVLAEAPAALKAYTALGDAFQKSSLSPAEQQVVILATSFENGCTYCVAAHTVVAGMQKVPAEVIEALRAGRPVPDPRLEALRVFTREVVEKRGWAGEEALEKFLQAGYSRAHVLEVLVGVTQKTLSNYLNHIAGTPLDPAFAQAAWRKPARETMG